MPNNNTLDNALFKLATKLLSTDLTVDIYATRADWGLEGDISGTPLQAFKLKTVSKDSAATFESKRIASVERNGTIYGLPRYTCTLALATDGTFPTMRGLANDDNGKNVIANRQSGRIVDTFPADSPCGIFVGNAEWQEMRDELETTINDKVLSAYCFDATTDASTGDGRMYFVIPEKFNGADLVRVHARVITAGVTGKLDIQVQNVTDGVDMLSTPLTIDTTEVDSDDADVPAVIDPTKDDVTTNDLISIDIDGVQGTPSKGLIITLEFRT